MKLEYNGLSLAKLNLELLVDILAENPDVDGQVDAILKRALAGIEEQLAYTKAVEYELLQTLRLFSKRSFLFQPIPRSGYPETYDPEHINRKLAEKYGAEVGDLFCFRDA